MIDVVIPYKPCGVYPGLELSYTIRGLKKHLKGLNQVVVVDEDIVPSVPGRKQRSIVEKIKWACQQPQISDPFICVSDDVYLLKDVDPFTLPYYHAGRMRLRGGRYDLYMKNTMNLGAVKNFDVHAPIRYEKEYFMQRVAARDWGSSDYMIQSLYCMGMEGEYIRDIKVATGMSERKLRDMVGQAGLRFSTGPNGITAAVRRIWEELYG